eukprot:3480135-Rhodomonas_salina.1
MPTRVLAASRGRRGDGECQGAQGIRARKTNGYKQVFFLWSPTRNRLSHTLSVARLSVGWLTAGCESNGRSPPPCPSTQITKQTADSTSYRVAPRCSALLVQDSARHRSTELMSGSSP